MDYTQSMQLPPQRQYRQQITFRHDARGLGSWVLNILWLVVAGWHLFLTWASAGVALCLTCIGFPCGWQAIKISMFLLLPFGKSLVNTHENLENEGAQCCFRSCNCVMNIAWAVTVGWIFAIQALLTGVLLMLTIVGIPFGWQCFKLTYLCLCPFGIDFTAETEETIHINTARPAPATPLPKYYSSKY